MVTRGAREEGAALNAVELTTNHVLFLHSYILYTLIKQHVLVLPVRLPGELRSSPPEIRGVLGPRLCFKTFMAVGVLT